MATESFDITGGKELEVLAGRLVKVPAATKVQLRARMRAAGQPMKTAVQRNALDIPVHGEKSTGLRQALARATKLRTTVTSRAVAVRVEVDPSAMPAGQEKLPALMESSGWTHEVFGRKDTAFQRGHAYFIPGISPHLPGMQAAVESAIADAVKTI
jgi:hypothetical protein